ncbi:hypothetical protein LEP1GSC194_2966 [Leptospira alstonii serovar Sichuan str. 79601]|uniref:Uncharacterized protein n=1 Tax=Leptospira alstonii serovar Sichuan str. 79601 TaxID=1218565 RepID=M6D8M9_9LEPT|nr:hypothetical protein LEP1GSC194_2966 [Leptospira alstonii serovar Sichuan str. 79601]
MLYEFSPNCRDSFFQADHSKNQFEFLQRKSPGSPGFRIKR